MLAEIGIMVGFYIMTRMLSLERTKEGKVSSFARVFSAVTFIVTALVVIDLEAFLLPLKFPPSNSFVHS